MRMYISSPLDLSRVWSVDPEYRHYSAPLINFKLKCTMCQIKIRKLLVVNYRPSIYQIPPSLPTIFW